MRTQLQPPAFYFQCVTSVHQFKNTLTALWKHFGCLLKTSFWCTSHQTVRFKVTEKSYNAATPTTEHRRAKTAQNSRRTKARNAVLLTFSMVGDGGLKSFRGLQVCDFVTAFRTAWWQNIKKSRVVNVIGKSKHLSLWTTARRNWG
jgi:hypothetical protein